VPVITEYRVQVTVRRGTAPSRKLGVTVTAYDRGENETSLIIYLLSLDSLHPYRQTQR